ncbi:hypothetical protein [Ruegeria profundi]|uniref:hypothetical protein n=1 Tax=Ruegeria profundi TaxID=1685378 RepID=UPI003C7ADCF3
MAHDQPNTGASSSETTAAIFLFLISVVLFVLRGYSPWGWPSLDMAYYYVEVQTPGFINGDFVTGCFSSDNGRALFGRLTDWPIRLGLEWDQSLYLWMYLNSALLPLTLFLGLGSILPRDLPALRPILFVFVLAAIAEPEKIQRFSVAWWQGWGYYFHPSLLSLSAFFGGLFLTSLKLRRFIILGYLCIFLSALLHPAFAIGASIFVMIISIAKRGGWALGGKTVATVLAGAIFLKLNSASGALSAQEYVQYFVNLHPEHYLPTRFFPLGPDYWYDPVWFLMVWFLVASTVLFLSSRRYLSILPLGFSLYYGGSLLAQYALVELYPVSTTIILLSPSRFLAFGYWMFVVSVSLMISVVLADCIALSRPSSQEEPAPSKRVLYLQLGLIVLTAVVFHEVMRGFDEIVALIVFILLIGLAIKFLARPLLVRVSQPVLPISAGSIFLVGVVLLSVGAPWALRHQKKDTAFLSQHDRAVIDWIAENTKPGDEIAAPVKLSIVIPLISGRGTYSGNGFPFADMCLRENFVRYVNLRGDPSGSEGRSASASYYAALELSQFETFVPLPDWVIMLASDAVANGSIAEAKPTYNAGGWVVFKNNGSR